MHSVSQFQISFIRLCASVLYIDFIVVAVQSFDMQTILDISYSTLEIIINQNCRYHGNIQGSGDSQKLSFPSAIL